MAQIGDAWGDGVWGSGVWAPGVWFLTGFSAGATLGGQTVIQEAEIVTGGVVFTITLTGATWNTAGAPFDDERQAIINGMSAATSPALGWNAEVRDKEVVTAVVRTSDTVVTITLTASALYDISLDEAITVTVPASAISVASALVADPVIQVVLPGTIPAYGFGMGLDQPNWFLMG